MEIPTLIKKSDLKALRDKITEQERAIEALKALKEANIPENQKGKVEKVFTDEKHSYYTWVNVGEIPAIRGVQLQVFDKIEEFGLTPEMVDEFTNVFTDLLNKGQIVEFHKAYNRFTERFKIRPVPDIILEKAAVLYVRDDEDFNSYDPAFARRKIADWKKDPKLLAFFLGLSLAEFYKVGNLSEESILNSLKELDEMDASLRATPLGDQYTSWLDPLMTLATQLQEGMQSRKKLSGK